MTTEATPGALGSNDQLGPLAPKRCEPCRATGAVHCSDPENCGGPWDKMHDQPAVEPAAEPTPGPWTLYRSERFAEYYVNQCGGPGYVCAMPLYEHRLPECEANARLVAAAPELLAALSALVDRCVHDGVPNDSRETWTEARDLVLRVKCGPNVKLSGGPLAARPLE